MARVSGPLFSMSASGTVGKAITFGIWKGRPWCRVWFKPENPKTEEQVNVRTAMKLIVAYWQEQTDQTKEDWDTYAAPFGMSGFNKFVGRAIDAYVLDPGVAVTPTSVSATGSVPNEVWTWNAP